MRPRIHIKRPLYCDQLGERRGAATQIHRAHSGRSLVGPSVGRLLGPLVGQLVGPLVGHLVSQLVGPLVGSLVGPRLLSTLSTLWRSRIDTGASSGCAVFSLSLDFSLIAACSTVVMH